ncbi:uncharacterized protein LOC114286860 [Camellia sinensis]|uniref:uncharacterized protein LOC114286860 n=1 Tax=Camellia sinensis TaxID=4442 RepID=UPI0010358627|nr:uncharacterized protein LOC114286860 [Camellia sinensis]
MLKWKIFPVIRRSLFSVLYVHTDVQRSENFPGISALRSIYDAIPINVRENLEAVYFLHPGLQSRLFLATFGRFIFSGGLYGKLRYVSKLDYLWDHGIESFRRTSGSSRRSQKARRSGYWKPCWIYYAWRPRSPSRQGRYRGTQIEFSEIGFVGGGGVVVKGHRVPESIGECIEP